MAWQDDGHGSAGCCGRSRRHRVRPLSCDTTTSHLIEVRPNRTLRIQHINARPRDARFEKEMQMQLLYKSRGLQAGVVGGGPLVMPQKKSVPNESVPNESVSQTATSHPNSIPDTAGGDNISENLERLSSATGKGVNLTSPSNVLVNVKDGVYTETGTSIHSEVQGQNKTSAHDQKSQDGDVKVSQSNPPPSTPSHSAQAGDSNTTHSIHQQTSMSSTGNNIVSDVSSTSQTTSTSPTHHGAPPGLSQQSLMLFFIHGVGGSSDIWQNQIQYFAREGYEIVAPDLIGHGLSCAPRESKPYHFNEIAADMEELFDKYCKKKNVIIAHSYGCSFAVVLARRRSRRVHKLVLISGGGPTPLAPQPGIFKLPTCMLGCFRPCLDCGFKKSAFHKQGHPAVDVGQAFAIPTYVLQHTMNGQIWPDGDEIFHQWLLCPTLLIHGAQDKLVSLKEEEHMEEVIFRSHLEVIKDASHMVMIEAPDAVNDLIKNFIREDEVGDNPPPPPPPPPPPEDRPVSRMSLKSTKSHKAMPSHLL